MTKKPQASGTILKKRRIRKERTLTFRTNIETIRNPDKIKNRLIPAAAIITFNCRNFGPSGSMCPASTQIMLIPRQPSNTGTRFKKLLQVSFQNHRVEYVSLTIGTTLTREHKRIKGSFQVGGHVLERGRKLYHTRGYLLNFRSFTVRGVIFDAPVRCDRAANANHVPLITIVDDIRRA